MKKSLNRAALLGAVALAAALLLGTFSALASAGGPWPDVSASGSPSASPSDSPSGSPSPTDSPTDTPTPTPTDTTTATPTPTPTPTPPPPLKVLSVTPRRLAKNVNPYSKVVIVFSTALAADTNLPEMTPKVPGTWTVDGASLVFRPKGHLRLYATEKITMHSGGLGPRGADGGKMTRAWATQFTVRGPSSLLRCQQLLAELNYLPLRFRLTALANGYALGAEPHNADLVSIVPLGGTFSWRFSSTPASLRATWKKGSYTTLVKSAVMTFESTHGLATDGVVGKHVWIALLKAAAAHKATTRAHDYIQVYTTLPEKLTVWRNGKIVFTAACNTGIASRPTPKATTPVWAHLTSTTMSGTNPDGSHYSDPGVPWVAYFNGGCAIHGFVRPGYGWPQSLGCVELSYANAAAAFKYDRVGTLVTVH